MRRRESSRKNDQTPPPETAERGRRRRGKHTRDLAGGLVPPVLPVVIAEAHGDDLVLTIDDRKDATETVPRGKVGTALARIVAEFGVPTRVGIHEADGRVLVDIFDPPHQEPEPTEPETSNDNESPEAAGLVEVSGGGFTPGEAVAVAVILRHTSAEADGVTRTLVDPALVPGAGGA